MQDGSKMAKVSFKHDGPRHYLNRLRFGNDSDPFWTWCLTHKEYARAEDEGLPKYSLVGRVYTRSRSLYFFLDQSTGIICAVDTAAGRPALLKALKSLVHVLLTEEAVRDKVFMVVAYNQGRPKAVYVNEVEKMLRDLLDVECGGECTQTVFVCPGSLIPGEDFGGAYLCFLEQIRLKESRDPGARRGLISVDYLVKVDNGGGTQDQEDMDTSMLVEEPRKVTNYTPDAKQQSDDTANLEWEEPENRDLTTKYNRLTRSLAKKTRLALKSLLFY